MRKVSAQKPVQISYIRHPIKQPKTGPMHATGPFKVKLTPQVVNPQIAAEIGVDDHFRTLGRLSIDKHYHGDLEATGTGEMLSMATPVEGSAGYVAIERVVGKLHGREGSFALLHTGIMGRGIQHLVIMVVPDSGTGELTGIGGMMDIAVVEGEHNYQFQYQLD